VRKEKTNREKEQEMEREINEKCHSRMRERDEKSKH
jgi:hypothetical protein